MSKNAASKKKIYLYRLICLFEYMPEYFTSINSKIHYLIMINLFIPLMQTQFNLRFIN